MSSSTLSWTIYSELYRANFAPPDSDTKLLHKSLILEITKHATSLDFATQISTRRCLLYLLVPRSPRHFPPALVANLAQTDEIKTKTSKKDEEVRRKEIREAASPDLVASIERMGKGDGEGGVEEMVRDPGGSLLVAEIMLYADGGTCSFLVRLNRKLTEVVYRQVGSD